MKKIIVFLILIALAILLAITIGISQKPKSTNQNNWQTFTSKELGFSITYPKEWIPHEETSNVSFEAKKNKGDPFAPYVRITKNLSGPDFDAVSAFNKIYDAKPNTKIENPNQGDIVIDATVTKVENLQVDGAKAAKILEESNIPGPFYAQRIYILKDNIVWVISSVAPTSEELDANSNSFSKALSSFKFLTN